MARADKIDLIQRAYDYNAKARAMASCNALYMGSMATAMLMFALGAEYGKDSLADALQTASEDQLDAGIDSCANIILLLT